MPVRLAALSMLMVLTWRTEVSASPRMIQVNGHGVAFYVTPGRLPVIVLDAWGGGDASEWRNIIPALSARTGSEIIAYDRAGFGASDEVKPPFKMQDAVNDLVSGLQALGAIHDLILVPHSFAGEIATYVARAHPDWIYGAVLVDANLPNFYTDEQTKRQYAEAKPLAAALLAKEPGKRSRSVAAMTGSMIATNAAFHEVAWPTSVPCTVIVSETTPFTSAIESRNWRQALADFADAAPNRTLVVAHGSSHDVPHDRPDVILQTVSDMVHQFRSGRPG